MKTKLFVFVFILSMVAMLCVPAVLADESSENDNSVLTTFTYGITAGNLGTAQEFGIGFSSPKKSCKWIGLTGKECIFTGNYSTKLEFNYMSYIDSRGSINFGGKHKGEVDSFPEQTYGNYSVFLTPRQQGTLTVSTGSRLGKSGKKFGYFCLELTAGSARGQYIRNYKSWEVVGYININEGPIYGYVPRQEFKSGSAIFLGLSIGPDIELYPSEGGHVGFLVGARGGVFTIGPFGEYYRDKLYFRGFAKFKVRL